MQRRVDMSRQTLCGVRGRFKLMEENFQYLSVTGKKLRRVLIFKTVYQKKKKIKALCLVCLFSLIKNNQRRHEINCI